MSIANSITALINAKTAITNAIKNKGGTVNSGDGFADFATDIETIPTGVTPTGTKTITANGTHDVTSYANAEVNVPSTGITPKGTTYINANGSYDVTPYANAEVNVPSTGITPTGTKTITENGTHDVTNFANAFVNVPTGTAEPAKIVRRTVTLADMTGKTSYYPTILTGDEFVKQNYSNEAFFILMRPVAAIAGSAYAITGLYHGNRCLVDGSSDFYGVAIQYNSAGTAQAFFGNTAKVSGTGYNAGFRAKSSGNVNLVLPANRNIKAGTYELIMGCITD